MSRRLLTYWGNRYPDVFAEHLTEIVDSGFSAVLHPVTEDDLHFYRGSIEGLCRQTRDAGLECWVDPLSVGNLFGLGASSRFLAEYPDRCRRISPSGDPQPYACPSNSAFRRRLDEWLTFVANAGAQWVLWDEPNFTRCYCDRCLASKTPVLDLLRHVTSYAHEHGLKNSVALLGLPLEGMVDLPIPHAVAALPHVDEIAVTLNLAYPEWRESATTLYVRSWCAMTVSAAWQFARASAVWIQGWNVPAGNERMLIRAAELARDAGIENVAHWGFRGCEAQGYARSEHPAAVWAAAGTICREVFGGKIV